MTPVGPPEMALMQRVAERDATALEELFDRFGAPCYAVAIRVLRDPQLAQDVTQEVFLAVWRDAGRFDGRRGALSSYLMSMTHHKAVDAVRREENQRRRAAPAEVLEAVESPAPSVEEQVSGLERATHVRRALADLPGKQREALLLAYFGGYTQREIAGLTGAPLGTVKTRMLAGMRSLRSRLGELSA